MEKLGETLNEKLKETRGKRAVGVLVLLFTAWLIVQGIDNEQAKEQSQFLTPYSIGLVVFLFGGDLVGVLARR